MVWHRVYFSRFLFSPFGWNLAAAKMRDDDA